MAAPLYSTEPSTTFLARLQSEGFSGWFSFDLAVDKTAFWKALAIGIQHHSEVLYPNGEGHFLCQKWRPKVQSILSVDSRYSFDPAKLSNPQFWADMGSACKSIAIEILRSHKKEHHVEGIEKGGILDMNVKSAYDTLVSALNLCICCYESRADSSIVTNVFSPTSRGEVALFITLAQEGNRLYFLYHNGVTGNIRMEFPFAMKVGETGKPMIIGSLNGQQREERDPRDLLIGHLMKAIQASVALTLSSADYLPQSASEPLRILQDRLRTAETYCTSTKQAVSLSSDAVTQLLSLQIKYIPPVRPRNPHTVVNCEEYPEEQEFVEFHGHKFHKTCMSRYLEGLQPSFPKMPKCPMEGCRLELPDLVLDLNITVRDIYVRMRQVSTEKAFIDRSNPIPSPSLPPIYLVTCKNCSRSYTNQYFMSHNCCICVECAYKSYSNFNGACWLCYQPFNSDDLQKLRMYYERTVGRAREV